MALSQFPASNDRSRTGEDILLASLFVTLSLVDLCADPPHLLMLNDLLLQVQDHV